MPNPNRHTPRGTMMMYSEEVASSPQEAILVSLGADEHDATDVLRFQHFSIIRNGHATVTGIFNWALDIVEDDHA